MGASRSGRGFEIGPQLTKAHAVDGVADDSVDQPRRNVHGRRRGHRLRPGQRELLERHLPDLELALPASGEGLLDLSSVFSDRRRDVWLEIGFGAGEHLAAQAAAHHECDFIGCEPYLNGVARFVADWHTRGLTNVRVFLDDALLLLEALPPERLGRIFLLFPDPWPKRRHHKRRIIAPRTLHHFARTLCDSGELRFATDHSEFCRWTLFHVLSCGAFDWHASGPSDWRRRPDDWPATRYESKAISSGRKPAFLSFYRRAR